MYWFPSATTDFYNLRFSCSGPTPTAPLLYTELNPVGSTKYDKSSPGMGRGLVEYEWEYPIVTEDKFTHSTEKMQTPNLSSVILSKSICVKFDQILSP